MYSSGLISHGNPQCWYYRTDLGRGGEQYTITEWTPPSAPGSPCPILLHLSHLQGKMSLNARDW